MKTTSENIEARLQKAKDSLLAAGIAHEQLSISTVDGSPTVADDILEEAERINAGLILVGCKGRTNAIEYSVGSTAKKMVNKAEKITVCLVP